MKTISFKYTPFEWIIIGFIIHAIGRIFFQTSKPVCYILCGLGLTLIFLNSIFRIKYNIPFKGGVRVIFFLYLIWSLGVILRPFIAGDKFNADGYSLINQYTWLAYFIPLVCFFKFNQFSLQTIFKFSNLYGFIGLILLVLFSSDIFSARSYFDDESYQQYIGITGIPTSFLVLTAYSLFWIKFIPKSHKYMAFLAWGLGLFTTAFAARRGGVFVYLLISLLYLYQFMFFSKFNFLKIILVIAAVAILGISVFSYINSTFTLLISRINEDTRSGVEQFFYQSFNGKELDWIFGRGINGTYYCPIFKNVYRDVIETGYLFMILKGGLIYLCLFMFILLYSAYLGFFKTKNSLSKAMSLYLLVHLISLIPFGLPSFSFEYIIVWICVLYCQSGKFRALTDAMLKNHFLTNFSYKTKHYENTLVR